MTDAIDIDLKKLKGRAFDRLEWAEKNLRRYYTATPNLDGEVASDICGRFTNGCSSRQHSGRSIFRMC